jgi:hypothetical protein
MCSLNSFVSSKRFTSACYSVAFFANLFFALRSNHAKKFSIGEHAGHFSPHVADAPFRRNQVPTAPPAAVPLPGALRSPLPPTLEIAALNWTVFDSIPQRARPSVAAAFARTVAELDSPDGWTLLFAFARVVLVKPRSRRCTSADVMIARSRRWPHEAAELLRSVADDYAASPPPRQSEQRFAVADIDLPRGWSTPELDTSVDLDSLPNDVARKILALARRGYFSRAVASPQRCRCCLRT